MAELAFPYYRIQADGPAESGFVIEMNVYQQGGGPLPGLSVESVVDGVKQLVTGDDVIVQVARYEITTTNNL